MLDCDEAVRVTACDCVCTDITQARSQHKMGGGTVCLYRMKAVTKSHSDTLFRSHRDGCHCHCASVHTQRRSHTGSHTASHNSRTLCQSRHEWGLSVTARLFHCVRLHSDTVTATHCVTHCGTHCVTHCVSNCVTHRVTLFACVTDGDCDCASCAQSQPRSDGGD